MIKKTIFSMAAVALLAVPAAVNAQASTVVSNATVGTYMNLTGSGDLAFGTLSRTAATTIDAAGGAGAATRSLSYNQNLTVSYASVPTTLSATVNSATVTLPVTLNCAYRIGTAAWSAASACSSASFAMDVGSALTAGTLGFGGSIAAADVANALAATYSGSFTIVLLAR